MKELKLKVGDIIYIDRKIPNPKGFGSCTYNNETWDVIKINKKSIALMRYPTNELKLVKK